MFYAPQLLSAFSTPMRANEKDRPKAVSAHKWTPDLFSEPSFRLSRGPKRSPSLNFARVRRAGVVEGLSCYLPMRFVSIGQPHVHHERISVVCAFDPNRARLWFQSHWDKNFPNYPAVAKNLRLEGTSAFRSRRSRGLNRRQADSFRAASQSLPPASPSGLDFSAGRHRTALRAQNAPAALLDSALADR